MKRLVLLMFIFILSTALIACDDTGDATETTRDDTDVEETEDEDTVEEEEVEEPDDEFIEKSNESESESVNEEDDAQEETFSEESKIESLVNEIISEDFNSTEINELKINKNMGLDDGSYIVLPHLRWDVKNKEKTTREMLEMYSDHLAAKLAEEGANVSEITVFWEVPYHAEGDNIAKFMYEKSGDGMSKEDNWYDPIIR